MIKKRQAAIIGSNAEIRQFLCDMLHHANFDVVGIEAPEDVPEEAELVLSILRPSRVQSDTHPHAKSVVKQAISQAQQRVFSKVSNLAQRLGIEAQFSKIQELLSSQNLEDDLRKKNASLEHLTEELKRANVELMRLAVTDALTGLNNRRHFMEALRRECQRALRYQRKLSLLMLDIDHFKQINDTHGHAAGDAVLVDFAQLISAAVRRTDLVARLGGEEFAVAFIETDLERARIAAEGLRQDVAGTIFTHHQTPIQITLSGGLVEFPSEAFDNHLALLEAADKALYEAKTEGRDRISIGA
jgi:diguanylate cyclase (GGDEF)-like protein